MNPATFIAHEVQEGEEIHDCATYTPEGISQAEEDPIPESEALFGDGSSMIDQETGIRHTGAAVVAACSHVPREMLQVTGQLALLKHLTAQAAELITLRSDERRVGKEVSH